MRRLLVLAVVLAGVLGATPGSAWTQYQGTPERDGVLVLPKGPLDVLSKLRLHAPEEGVWRFPGTAYVATPHGVLGVATEASTGACVLLRFPPPAPGASVETDRQPLEGCENPRLQGYDPGGDVIVLCTTGDAESASLQLRDAKTGALRFRVGLFPQVQPAAPADAATGIVWACGGGALDSSAREIVVPVTSSRAWVDYARHAVLSVDLDTGQVRWRSTIPLHAASQTGFGLGEGLDPNPDFFPYFATLTATGVVVGGIVMNPQAPYADPRAAVGWLTRNGFVRGLALAEEGAGAAVVQGGYFPAASGRMGVQSFGHKLLFIEPSYAEPVAEHAFNSLEPRDVFFFGSLGTFGPIWEGDRLYVPLVNGIIAVDTASLEEAWTWSGLGGQSSPWNVAATPQGELLVIMYTGRSGEASLGEPWTEGIALVRLDATTGEPLQVIPLPLQDYWVRDPDYDATFSDLGWAATLSLLPLPEGILVVSVDGQAVLVGPSSGEPGLAITASEAYPVPGERVEVVVELPEAREILEVGVAWGDGTVDRQAVPPGTTGLFRTTNRTERLTFTHAYRSAEREEATFTTVFGDNTTSSTTLVFDVGGTPPRDLTWIQRQFEPESQDRTWGVLGIALAAIGGGYGFLFRRRRQGRIRRELAALDAIHDLSRDSPGRALAELAARRRRLRDDLLAGHLDEAQFAVVAARAGEISQRLHRQILGPIAERLSPGFRSLLDAGFADGTLTPGEAGGLMARLDAEDALTPEERARLRNVLQGWASDPS